MQYNSEANEQDLVSLFYDFTGMDSSTYPINKVTRLMNSADKDIRTWIWEAYGGWQWDDANNTSDFPAARTALVANQTNYGIPTEAETVVGAEFLLPNSTSWQRLHPTTFEQIRERQAEAEFMKTPSTPQWYVLVGRSVKLYPPANYSQDASLRLLFGRGVSGFSPNDTTKEPGFDSTFHEAVPTGAAVKFSSFKSIPNADRMASLWKDYEVRIKKFYQRRYEEAFPPNMSVRDDVREAI